VYTTLSVASIRLTVLLGHEGFLIITIIIFITFHIIIIIILLLFLLLFFLLLLSVGTLNVQKII
jgi:hypothetical protein